MGRALAWSSLMVVIIVVSYLAVPYVLDTMVRVKKRKR